MFHVHVPKPWSRRGRELPPLIGEAAYLERRALLKALGFAGLACALPELAGAGQDAPTPVPRNERYKGERALTPEEIASKHNNYYEFLPGHAGDVRPHAQKFQPRPWKLEIAGEVEQPKTIDIDELLKIAPLEERVYRHRCVEAWSMVVPWTGLPLAQLVKWCRPKPSAKFVRFVSFDKPEQAPGIASQKHYPWPYFEGLRLDEAMHELAFVVTGVFGHGLPVPFGAPLRIHVPWKYGYKSPKAIVKIELTASEPKTFWSELAPREYPFTSNVDPKLPHPRWSQEQETDLGTGDRIRTRYLNGYDALVGALYAK